MNLKMYKLRILKYLNTVQAIASCELQASPKSACMPSVTEDMWSYRIYSQANCCLGCTDHKEHENVTGAFCIWSPRAWALCGITGRDKIIGCRWPAEHLVRVEDVLNKKSDPVKAEKEGGRSRSALTALWAPSWVSDLLFCLDLLTCGMSSQPAAARQASNTRIIG